MISTGDLTKMRAMADDWLPDTCTIQTMTAGVDALGGITQTYNDTYTGVSCRVDPTGQASREHVVNMATEGLSIWMLNLKYDQAIGVTDRVVHDGKTYHVVGVIDTQSYRTIRRAMIKRVN